jgi:hypothetical protein
MLPKLPIKSATLSTPIIHQTTSETAEPAEVKHTFTKKSSQISLALSPIENDLLGMNIKYGGEAAYNIHELPASDGKSIFCKK